MTYRVLIRPAAERNFEDQYDYLVERTPQGAAAWVSAFVKALQSLAANPLSYSLAPEDENHDSEIRQLLFKTRKGRTYRALFTVRENDVFILHIRGPGQDLLTPDEMDPLPG